MRKTKNIIERCNEIIKVGEHVLESHEPDFVRIKIIAKTNTSIENIYSLCFPRGIPDHLRLGNFIRTLTNLGIVTIQLNAFGIFAHRLESFKGFKEDLEKGIITRDLAKIVTLDIFNDMIEQAQNLRSFNTEPLNRAACVLGRIVIEDTLKKLCYDNGIALSSDKASVANDELKKHSIIVKEQWRLNQVWLDIGNKAAHPETQQEEGFSSITEDKIDDMLNSIKQFAEKNL